jgi:hypothetical protein
MRNGLRRLLGAAFGTAAMFAAAAVPTAVEFFHPASGHYFVTSIGDEIAALDAGVPGGWQRTGESFGVFDVATPGASRVCRYWSGTNYAPRSSHFYSPLPSECAKLAGDSKWRYEGDVFALDLPASDGACAPGLLPLYRVYNEARSGAPNHRYTIRASVRRQMVALGWTPEGAGLGVAGCVPPSDAPQLLQGRVLGGTIEGATVCLDTDGDGRCGSSEPHGTSDAAGTYRLTVPRDADAAIVAEVVAGVARDVATGNAVDASFRLASPRAYGTDLTVYSTLVTLERQGDVALAEDLARADLGLPPSFDIGSSTEGPRGSLKASVAGWVLRALKAHGFALDLASPRAKADLVGAFSIALTDLPQLVIETKDGAPIASKEIYVDATFVLTNPAAAVPAVALAGRIRGRGNTTWGQPKNPYKVQFANDAAYAAIGDVLGMRKQRNWALLADWFDRSLIRNKLALSLGASSVFSSGLRWTPSGQHVEVVLNDDYVGVYLLTEDIRIDPARLPLKKMGAKDVDGGYIVEVDSRLDCYQGDDLDLHMITARNVPFCVDTPDEEAITPAQLAYVKTLLADVEADVYGARRLERIHAASFADWYLLQELFRNNDAIFISSDFMWKDTDAAARPQDRLLNMGPLWDFDRAAGNINYNDNWLAEGCWVSKGHQPNWFAALFDSPDFVALTLSRWKDKRPALEAFVNGAIEIQARRLRVAQQHNFQRWPTLGETLVNYYTFASHDEEVAFVRRFLNERMTWLDKAYASPEAFHALCK